MKTNTAPVDLFLTPRRLGRLRQHSARYNGKRLLCADNAAWILLLVLVGLPASAQDQFTHTRHNGTITITKYTGPDVAVTIPSTITGLPVTEVGGDAFQNRDKVTSVFIPKSVTNIIVPPAFLNCAALTNLTVDADNPVYSSRDGVLFNKAQDDLIMYPANKRGGYSVPNSVTNITEEAFSRCGGLTSVRLPESVNSIGGYVFSGCTGLQSVTIPDSVTNISSGAFRSCTNLTKVTIGKGVVRIFFSPWLEWAFENCTSLTNYAVDPLNLSYSSRDGTLYNKTQDTLISYPAGKAGDYILPDSVTQIGDGAFSLCARLTGVTIPSSVTKIGSFAFSYCSGLQSVTIPSGVNRIEWGTFEGCTALTNLTIGNGVIDIGGRAFFGCTGLTSITFPSNVASIDFYALSDCAALRTIVFAGDVPPLINQPIISGATHATVYYLPGTRGWESTFSGRFAVLWNPVIQVGGDAFGVRGQGFSFNITGTTNVPIVVEASTNLADGAWAPLQALRLTNGLVSFTDLEWTQYPKRFYRIRSP